METTSIELVRICTMNMNKVSRRDLSFTHYPTISQFHEFFLGVCLFSI